MTNQPPDPKIPRINFCWVCGRPLFNDHYGLVRGPDGYERIVHMCCAKKAYDQLNNSNIFVEDTLECIKRIL